MLSTEVTLSSYGYNLTFVNNRSQMPINILILFSKALVLTVFHFMLHKFEIFINHDLMKEQLELKQILKSQNLRGNLPCVLISGWKINSKAKSPCTVHSLPPADG